MTPEFRAFASFMGYAMAVAFGLWACWEGWHRVANPRTRARGAAMPSEELLETLLVAVVATVFGVGFWWAALVQDVSAVGRWLLSTLGLISFVGGGVVWHDLWGRWRTRQNPRWYLETCTECGTTFRGTDSAAVHQDMLACAGLDRLARRRHHAVLTGSAMGTSAVFYGDLPLMHEVRPEETSCVLSQTGPQPGMPLTPAPEPEPPLVLIATGRRLVKET